MSSLDLVPASTGNTRGTFTVTGAGTAHEAMADASNSSYINLASTVTQHGWYGASAFFQITPQSLPFKARVKYIMPYARAATTGGTNRTFFTRIHDGRYATLPWTATIPYNLTTTITDFTGFGETYAPASPTYLPDSVLRPLEGTTGDVITQEILDKLHIEVFGFFDTDVRFYKMGIHVEYDAQPTVNITSPVSGGSTDSSSPQFAWEYFDDTESQSAYEVEVYSGSTRVYTSGVRRVGSFVHQYEGAPLANGTYTVKIRASQFWNGTGGEFWSEWAVREFTVATSSPATPRLDVVEQLSQGRVAVTVQPFFNLLGYNAVGSESNITGGHPDWYGLSNATIASSATTLARTNAIAHVMTLTGGTGIVISEYVPVRFGTSYSVSVYARRVTGSPALGHVSLRWFDSSGATIATVNGNVVTVVDSMTEYTIPETAAPSGAISAAILFVFGGVTSDQVLLDDATIVATDGSTPSTASSIRGGLFNYSDRNMINRVNATMANGHRWTGSAAGHTVTSETSQSRNGTDSIKLKNQTGGAATVETRLGDLSGTGAMTESSAYFEVTPGEVLRVNASVYSPVTSRTVNVIVRFHTDPTTASASSQSISGSSVVGAWTEISGNITVPADQKYGRMAISVTSAANNEEHFFDRVSVSRNVQTYIDNNGQWREGYRSIEGPFVGVEWSEDEGETWTSIFVSEAWDYFDADVTIYDYEIADSTPREYRAQSFVTVDGITYRSAFSNIEGPFSVQLEQIWLHVKGDEEATAFNFLYPTPGRTETIDNGSKTNYFEGREYPLTEFSEYRDKTLQVQLQLLDDTQLNAFRAMVERKALVVYRDQRGRRGIANLSSASITDEQWGNSAGFTVTLTGDQI